MNNIKKVFKVVVFLCVFVIMVYECALFKMKYMETHGYTKYDLSIHEMVVLDRCLNVVDSRIEKWKFIDRPDYFYFHPYDVKKLFDKLMLGVYADKLIDKFNNDLFALQDTETALELAKQYGFNEENPITAEWILTHPKETVAILDSCKTMRSELRDYHFDLTLLD